MGKEKIKKHHETIFVHYSGSDFSREYIKFLVLEMVYTFRTRSLVGGSTPLREGLKVL